MNIHPVSKKFRRTWTDDEHALLKELVENDTPRGKIAEIMGKSYSSVTTRISDLGLTTPAIKAKRLSTSRKEWWNSLSPKQREEEIKKASWSRKSRGLAYPEPYETERNKLIRNHGMHAHQADEEIKKLMLIDKKR